MYSSFVSLGKFIPRYLILFVAMVNGIDSLISFSDFSLLVYRNTSDFSIWSWAFVFLEIFDHSFSFSACINYVLGESIFALIPPSMDWKERGYVTPVKNQDMCGSCWAFSIMGAPEGQMFQKTGKLVSLSEHNLVDCSQHEGNQGCHSGLMDNAFQYVLDVGGLDSEESYPYTGLVGHYNPNNSAANETVFMDLPKQEKALMKAVATLGPISVAIDAGNPSFQFYKSGIYYEPKCISESLNHAVLAVGYGFEGADSDMAKDQNNHCGIATMASYPTV
ncbi:hypothetical protein FD755_000193 [Muntiacus reevesi]|uniref:Peptidase C1A papain C-terminal domain-containing protein n=1 Tax=Muntiacus reevesi TaxID=9886 RepID=A0A5J5MXX0_MUNRE|nr:hypothetical protein FD755_000193 [Muntiacus reevesi]